MMTRRSPLNDEAFKNIYFTQDASQVDHILSAHIEVCAHVELTFLVRQPHTAPLRDIDDLPAADYSDGHLHSHPRSHYSMYTNTIHGTVQLHGVFTRTSISVSRRLGRRVTRYLVSK